MQGIIGKVGIHGGIKQMDRYKEGMAGEKIVRKIFSDSEFKYFQADLLFKVGENWNLAEVKRQEMFEPPPFHGHGLPIWQLEQRVDFYKDTGIMPYLFVVDKITQKIYWQTMIKLMEGKYYDTKNKDIRKRRRIFLIDTFMEW